MERPLPRRDLYSNWLSVSTQLARESAKDEQKLRREDSKLLARELVKRKTRGCFHALVVELKLRLGEELQKLVNISPPEVPLDTHTTTELRKLIDRVVSQVANAEEQSWSGVETRAILDARLQEQADALACLREQQTRLWEKAVEQQEEISRLVARAQELRPLREEKPRSGGLMRLNRQQLEESVTGVSLGENSIVEMLMDDQGYLLDSAGSHILDDYGQPVRLKEADIAYLQANNLYEEAAAPIS